MTEEEQLFTFNPLAPDYLNGLVEIGTPAGCEDIYAEEVWWSPPRNLAYQGAASNTFVNQKKYFTGDFLIYGLKATTPWEPGAVVPAISWSVRLIDVDGVPMCNTRVKGEMIFGIGQFPKPCIPPLFVPAGCFLGIDFEYESGPGGPESDQLVQLVFLGLRRRKVGGV